jgi:pimeloyl-ACP methyl ester carboxylesterase
MKRFALFILTLFLFLINTSVFAGQSLVKKDISVTANDGFNLKASLTYPKVKGQKEFNTVILLHSHGTDSQWWLDLPQKFLDKGYAVLTIDMRGHGKSVYNSNLVKVSWKSLTNSAYKKYPDDVIKVIEYIKDEFNRITFFDNYAIIGSDIGGSAGVIAADKMPVKPKTIVLLSPVVQTRGLYIPVSIAQLSDVDFLSISSAEDSSATEAEKYLKRFAQNEFITIASPAGASGMVLLKNDPEVIPIITEWVGQYLKN